jgi:hypothetical protein
VAFRKHTLLPLDDGLYALQATIPQLTRSALHRCLARHGISRLPHLDHPWTNGQVERMNRTIKEATGRTYHDDGHAQLREHLAAFLKAYNFAKRLKTLAGLTSFQFICSCWQKQPGRFITNPHRLSSGLNSYPSRSFSKKSSAAPMIRTRLTRYRCCTTAYPNRSGPWASSQRGSTQKAAG